MELFATGVALLDIPTRASRDCAPGTVGAQFCDTTCSFLGIEQDSVRGVRTAGRGHELL